MPTLDDMSDVLLAFANELLELQEFPRRVAELAAPKIARVVDEEFAQGVDPGGAPWAPLKDGSGRTPLNRTGATRRGVRVTAEGLKVRVRFPNIMNVLQSQSKKLGRRPARPVGWRSELPSRWAEAIEEAAEEAKSEVEERLADLAK